MGEKKKTRLAPEKRTGLVVVLTGDGKGKTTSALGMALRATGHGMRTAIVQFMKGDIHSGELESVSRLGPEVEMHVMGKGFCGIRGDSYSFEEHREDAQKAVRLSREKITSGDYGLVVLDEINNSVKLGLVDLAQAVELIKVKPPETHLVLTGRDAAAEVVDMADTVSEVREVKHAYRKGVEPQPGVDY